MTDAKPDGDTATTNALLEDLRVALGLADLSYASAPTPIGGGYWADIFAIRLAGAPPELRGDLIARIMPDPLLGRRETIVQREVAGEGFPAPAVRVAGEGKALGRAYMVMDRASGEPLLSGLSAAKAVTSLPRVLRRLPRLLASTALELHLLDPAPVVDALNREVPQSSIDVTDMIANLEANAGVNGDALLREATTWLTETQPEPERVSICHGDLHPFNVLVDDEDNVTLIDWTASRIAEPAFDLAFTTLMIRGAPLDIPRSLQPPIRKAAAHLANDVIRTYRELAKPHGIALDDDRLAWHTALQCTRVLAEVVAGLDGRVGHPFLEMEDGLRAQLQATVRA